MTSPQINARRQLATHLAFQAGGLLVRGEFDVRTVQAKSSPTDITTALDYASESLIVDGIRKQFPDDGIFAEEGSAVDSSSGFVWIVDPLDGTANFVRSLRASVISIALAQDDVIVMGVVFDPYANEMFVGITGEGAFCNDRPLRLPAESEAVDLSGAFVGLSGSNRPGPREIRAELLKLLAVSSDSVRDTGSTALSLCWTAAGRFNAHLGLDVAWWDFAAAMVVAREAGCIASGINGEVDPAPEGFLVSQPQLRKDLILILAEAGISVDH